MEVRFCAFDCVCFNEIIHGFSFQMLTFILREREGRTAYSLWNSSNLMGEKQKSHWFDQAALQKVTHIARLGSATYSVTLTKPFLVS